MEPPLSPPRPVLHGLALRSLLVVRLVDAHRPLTVADLVRAVNAQGFDLAGRPSKVIADALRWEVARGRATRLGRGRYAAGAVARSTRHRMRARVAAAASAGRAA